MKISEIPIEELIKDKEESLKDIDTCTIALSHGVTNYSGGLVNDRMEVNKGIVKKIDKELNLRISM